MTIALFPAVDVSHVHPETLPGNRERGFTLVELLVVIAIVSILSAIALTQFTAYKKQAIDTQMQSDLSHARTSMEDYYQRNNYTYAGVTVVILEADHGYKAQDVPDPLGSLRILSADDTSYSIRSCVPHGSYLSYRYDSAGGLIVGENVAC